MHFKLSYAICSNLDQSKILSSGDGLNQCDGWGFKNGSPVYKYRYITAPKLSSSHGQKMYRNRGDPMKTLKTLYYRVQRHLLTADKNMTL